MTIAQAFTASKIETTIKEIDARLTEIGETLEWIDDERYARPYQKEARILQATLGAIRAQYGSSFVDSLIA